MKPHELDNSTRRRFAAGLVGGFMAIAVGTAPYFHERATLPATIEIEGFEYSQDGTRITDIWFILTNKGQEEIDPIAFTWDQKRKTRHNWPIEDGPGSLAPGGRAEYWIAAPGEEGQVHAGLPAQLTIFDRGEQRWQSVHFEADLGGFAI